MCKGRRPPVTRVNINAKTGFQAKGVTENAPSLPEGWRCKDLMSIDGRAGDQMAQGIGWLSRLLIPASHLSRKEEEKEEYAQQRRTCPLAHTQRQRI